jgi:tripartite-type tricarboxylate transporter receptor subunit TctC
MKRLIRASLIGATLLATSLMSAAAAYPESPIRLVIPFSPGGSTDTFGRILAGALQTEVGQSVIVENKPGAGGNIGADMVAKSAPNGYTLLLAQDSLTIVPWLYKSLSFDVMRDFKPIGIGVYMPMVLVVSNELPVKNLTELIAYVKANPNKLSYGTPGVGTAHHLNFESFLAKSDMKMTPIPYKGASGMNTDLASGNVHAAFTALSSALPLLDGGKIRAIAVAQLERSPLLPNVPTVAETIPGFQANVWFGLMAPAGTPDAITNALSEDMKKAVLSPTLNKRLTDLGYRTQPSTPSQMLEIMKREYDQWGKLISTVGISAE